VASAASISQTRAEIARLSDQLAQEQKTSEITANKYDLAKATYAALTHNIRALQANAVVLRRHINVTTTKLVKADLSSYIYGTATTQTVALFNQNVTTSDARAVYQSLVIGDLNKLRDQLTSERQALFQNISQVNAQRLAAQSQTNQMQALLTQNIRLADQTRNTLNVVSSRLRTQIIDYEIQAGAAAARVRNVAGEASAVAAASQVGGQAAANEVVAAIQAATPPVAQPVVSGSSAGSSAGLAAVRYAESQIGVPYVWGGETPGLGFDCSGLVQWAWARAGFSMPRTTETQWAALPHVPLSQLRPGDLLFYYNLDGDNAVDHVTMYVGSGPWGSSTTIAAAHTGTNISLAPIFTFGLIGAARP